jgi:hypothetical protein
MEQQETYTVEQHARACAHELGLEMNTDAALKALARSEVALSDDLSASFHREAGSLSLISEHSVLFLDRTETYRLCSLLEAELKGDVS